MFLITMAIAGPEGVDAAIKLSRSRWKSNP